MEMGAEHCFVLNFWKGSLGARIYSPGLLPARSLLRALTHSRVLARTRNASVCEYEQQKSTCSHSCFPWACRIAMGSQCQRWGEVRGVWERNLHTFSLVFQWYNCIFSSSENPVRILCHSGRVLSPSQGNGAIKGYKEMEPLRGTNLPLILQPKCTSINYVQLRVSLLLGATLTHHLVAYTLCCHGDLIAPDKYQTGG